MAEEKPTQFDFDTIAADIEAARENGSDDKFWECAEHILGEMHKNRQIIEMAGEMKAPRRSSPLPMDPVDRLKSRIEGLVHDIADLLDEERRDALETLLDALDERLGKGVIDELIQIGGARLTK